MVLLVLPFWVGGLLSTGLELVEGTSSELPLQMQKEVTDSNTGLSWHHAEMQNMVGPAHKWMVGNLLEQQKLGRVIV